ncbi:MAG: putative collagen-binding domain-containing protein, partial [Bacteroidota bacterium]
ELRMPNQNVLVNNSTEGLDRVVANSATDSSYVLVYTPNGAAFEVNLDYVKDSTTRFQWFNPRTGEIDKRGEFARKKATHTFVPPSQGDTFTGHDWILILD